MKKLQAVVESQPTDEMALDYDPLNPFVICAASKTPVYRGNELLTCPVCKASYKTTFKDQICSVCEVGGVGGVGSGLMNVENPRRML